MLFLDYVVERFPFRIHTVRTDNGHEFQAKFQWHVEDLGMRHVYIKSRTARLNGKWSAHIRRMRQSSTSYSPIRMIRIFESSFASGRISTTSNALTQLTAEKLLSKFSEIG
jgi:hypothetical protein